jgi:hypothetical protein
MPSLVRFLTVVGVIAALIYAGLWVLAHVTPTPREMSVTVRQDRLGK